MDRCGGTLTKVSRGSVAVRDFRRRKTVVVKAGKSGEALTIGGAGADATFVHATGAFRVFHIANTNDAVDFPDLTTSGGNVSRSGGGVLNQSGSGFLTVEDSVVEGNRATTGGAGNNGGGGDAHKVTRG